jgi:hypothetical protein
MGLLAAVPYHPRLSPPLTKPPVRSLDLAHSLQPT